MAGEPSPPLAAVRGRRVVTAEGMRPATLLLAGGRIRAVAGHRDGPAAGPRVLDAGDLVISPGLVDTHVHVNEPGRSRWEGFASATRAAAAGGVTTLVDMPLNCVPATTTAAALAAKRRAAASRCRIDVGFWGGVVPANADPARGGELAALAEAGVLGFKAFLVDSGVPEFPAVSAADLRRALPAIAAAGLPLLVHSEDPEVIEAAERRARAAGDRSYAGYLASRPATAEVKAIRRLLALCREHAFRLHVVHLATAEALPALRRARGEGLPVSVETCPHYLTFAAEEIGRDTPAAGHPAAVYKCAPPIRAATERERLWRALADGDIDLVASDHSPCPPRRKALATGDCFAAWGGIASLQLTLPAVWSGARRRGIGLEDLARWLSQRPAELAGLAGRKGRLAAGADADLVIWDPEARFTVDPEALEHRHPLTPYAGCELHGVVAATVLRGRPAYFGAELGYPGERFPGAPDGELLRRTATPRRTPSR